MGGTGKERISGNELLGISVLRLLDSFNPELALEERLILVKDELMEALFNSSEVLQGQQSLSEMQPVLTPICELKVERIPITSVFCDLYLRSVGKLVFFGLNLEDCEPIDGIFLIAIKEEEPMDSDFPWSVGWITKKEIASLFEELPVMRNL